MQSGIWNDFKFFKRLRAFFPKNTEIPLYGRFIQKTFVQEYIIHKDILVEVFSHEQSPVRCCIAPVVFI